MTYRNLTTGEISPAHLIGTTEDGKPLYQSIEGYEPTSPYSCVEDGNWIDGDDNSMYGFEDDFGRLDAEAFVEIDGARHLCCEGDSGYILYDDFEWNNAGTADHEADDEGNVTRLGRRTGQVLPQSVMDAAVS